MTRTLALLLATTAATLTLGLPVFGAMQSADIDKRPSVSTGFAAEVDLPDVMLVDSDDDEVDGEDEDCDDDDDGEDDDGEDDDGENGDDCLTSASPAPAGTTAPPDNGLFNNGTPPKVQVN